MQVLEDKCIKKSWEMEGEEKNENKHRKKISDLINLKCRYESIFIFVYKYKRSI